MFQQKNKEQKPQREKEEKTFAFDDVIIEQIRLINEISNELHDPENTMPYYYRVDTLYNMLYCWFEEYPELKHNIDLSKPEFDNNQEMTSVKQQKFLEHTKVKYNSVLKLIHLKGLDKKDKKGYNLDVGVDYGITTN